jgi:hypothetical protein
MNRQRSLVCAIILSGIISMVFAIPLQLANAHTFSGSESSSFLSLVHKIRVESQLVLNNVGNATLAAQHAEAAANALDNQTIDEIAERNNRIASELPSLLQNLQNAVTSTPVDTASLNNIISNLDAILAEAVTVRIEQEQLNNATVQAIVLADILDEVLRNYGSAFDVGFDMTNMSLMGEVMQNMNNTMSMNTTGNNGSNLEEGHSMHMNNNTSSSSGVVVNMSAYQSAQAYANEALEIFQNDLKPLSPTSATAEANNSSNQMVAISQIENSLVKLQQALNNQAPPEEIMMIVHAEIHPNLQVAYNLQIIS